MAAMTAMAATMAGFGYNETMFFHSRYNHAVKLFEDGEKEAADDICRYLVLDAVCPPFLKVHSWQLRSLCTLDYFDVREFLGKCFSILQGWPREDPTVVKLREHTETMIKELDEIWEK
jgi:hypothetical protein